MTSIPSSAELSTPCPRLVANWQRIAGEEVRVIERGAFIYATGSELAALRLLHAYRHDPAWSDVRQADRSTEWVFSLQRRIS